MENYKVNIVMFEKHDCYAGRQGCSFFFWKQKQYYESDVENAKCHVLLIFENCKLRELCDFTFTKETIIIKYINTYFYCENINNNKTEYSSIFQDTKIYVCRYTRFQVNRSERWPSKSGPKVTRFDPYYTEISTSQVKPYKKFKLSLCTQSVTESKETLWKHYT